MEKSCQVSISQRRAVVCLYSSFTHISSEFLSLPAWGESLIGEGPCPRVKWHREAGSEYCPLPSSWASTVLSFQGLLSQPPRKKGKGAEVTAGPYDRADKLSVVTQCQFSSALTILKSGLCFLCPGLSWSVSAGAHSADLLSCCSGPGPGSGNEQEDPGLRSGSLMLDWKDML